jgi:hypothetical protein
MTDDLFGIDVNLRLAVGRFSGFLLVVGANRQQDTSARKG